MNWLNYHHLLYFWVVAREGSIVAATSELNLASSTISAQIQLLEESIGEKLFRRSGRGLALTDVGQVVFRYADEIFSVGRELMDYLAGRPVGRPMRVNVGVADVVPKLVAHTLLQPMFEIDQEIHLVCREDTSDHLLADLAMHQLDVVISEAPLGPGTHIKVYNHLLAECSVSFFAAPALAEAHSEGFPGTLDEAPFLLPTSSTVIRTQLEHWFDENDIHPMVAAEFEDSALMKVYGQGGHGVFAAPTMVRDEVERQYEVVCIGETETIKERFYAVSGDRKIRHPAVEALTRRYSVSES